MILLLFKLTQERLETQLTSKQKGVIFGSTEPKKDICLELNVVLFLRIRYLLLTEFEGSTISYEVFHFNLWPKCKAWGPWIEVEKQCGATYRTDWENEASSMFITFLGNWIEPESTPQSQAVCTLHYGPLNQPVTVQVLPERYDNTSYYMANPVLGKSLSSDWFFLSQDFAVRTVSMEMVQSAYFCFEARPANSKFATKTAKKKCE